MKNQKISEKLKGNKNALGVKRSEETRRKIADAVRQQWATRRDEMVKAVQQACSQSHLREKSRERALRRWRENPDGWNIAKGERNGSWHPDRLSVGRVGQGFTNQQRCRLLREYCEFCGSTNKLELDHRIPVVGGGTNNDSNAQTLCRVCNQKKRVTELRELRERGELRKNPNPEWVGNSEPSEDGNILVGATTRGRVYRRKGTRFRRTEVFCAWCGTRLFKTDYELRRSRRSFCSFSCRSSFYSNNPA